MFSIFLTIHLLGTAVLISTITIALSFLIRQRPTNYQKYFTWIGYQTLIQIISGFGLVIAHNQTGSWTRVCIGIGAYMLSVGGIESTLWQKMRSSTTHPSSTLESLSCQK